MEPKRYISRDARSKSYKLIDEVYAALLTETVRASGTLKLKSRTPTIEEDTPERTHVLNWILARYFAMPDADRDRFIVEGKEETDRHLEHANMVLFEGDWPFRPAVPGGEIDKPSEVRPLDYKGSAKKPAASARRKTGE